MLCFHCHQFSGQSGGRLGILTQSTDLARKDGLLWAVTEAEPAAFAFFGSEDGRGTRIIRVV